MTNEALTVDFSRRGAPGADPLEVGPAPPPEWNTALKVAFNEAHQHQQTLSANSRLLNVLGVLLPLLGCVLLVPLALDLPRLPNDRWAVLLLGSVAMLGLLLHFTWTEFINLIRYKYSVLYPRLCSLSGHRNWTNYLEFTTPRSLMSWIPAFLYNALAALILIAIWVRFLLLPASAAGPNFEAWALCALGAVSILALFGASHITLISARRLERDIKFCLGRVHHPPLPFTSALQLVPFGDQCRYMVAGDLEVELGSGVDLEKARTLVICKGFSTDLASVPRVFWPLFPPWEQYGPAALLHDYLYSLTSWDRKRCDVIFKEVMRELGVGAFTRNVIYAAVRIGGATAKQSAERRHHPDKATQDRILERFRRNDQDPVYARPPGGGFDGNGP